MNWSAITRSSVSLATLTWLLVACGGSDGGPTPTRRPSTVGEIELSLSTTGIDPDFDGYEVLVNGSFETSVIPEGTITLLGLSPGAHQRVSRVRFLYPSRRSPW